MCKELTSFERNMKATGGQGLIDSTEASGRNELICLRAKPLDRSTVCGRFELWQATRDLLQCTQKKQSHTSLPEFLKFSLIYRTSRRTPWAFRAAG